MTTHLDRYDGELWCGRHRDDDGMSAHYETIREDCDGVLDTAERLAEVDCEACLTAAIAFGERCLNRRAHLQDPGASVDTTFGYDRPIAQPKPVHPLLLAMIDEVVSDVEKWKRGEFGRFLDRMLEHPGSSMRRRCWATGLAITKAPVGSEFTFVTSFGAPYEPSDEDRAATDWEIYDG